MVGSMTEATLGDIANDCQGVLSGIAKESCSDRSCDPERGRAYQLIAAIVPAVGQLEDLGKALRKLRGARPQADVARASGLASSVINRVEMGHQAPSVASLDALLTALGLTLHDLAEALDEVAGRSAPARAGKPDARLVSQLAARGSLSGDFLEGLAATALAPEDAANFVATVEAAAAALAEQALERARAGSRIAGGNEDPEPGKR